MSPQTIAHSTKQSSHSKAENTGLCSPLEVWAKPSTVRYSATNPNNITTAHGTDIVAPHSHKKK